jgi:hypothetical protein
MESGVGDFFNDPIVHWYRNIFSHVPSTKVREIAAMLRAIHAGEDIAAAREKAIRVIEKLNGLRLARAAKLVEVAVEETLAYYAFPEEHWRRIRTNNPPRAHPARTPAAHDMSWARSLTVNPRAPGSASTSSSIASHPQNASTTSETPDMLPPKTNLLEMFFNLCCGVADSSNGNGRPAPT